jgi:hypothetical protein
MRNKNDFVCNFPFAILRFLVIIRRCFFYEAAKRVNWLNLAVFVYFPLLATTKAPELDAEVCGVELGGLSLSGADLSVPLTRMPFRRTALSVPDCCSGGLT